MHDLITLHSFIELQKIVYQNLNISDDTFKLMLDEILKDRTKNIKIIEKSF